LGARVCNISLKLRAVLLKLDYEGFDVPKCIGDEQ